MARSYSNNFQGSNGLQWTTTELLNGGTAPAHNAANAELQMCEEGQVWSKGGNCFPSSRTLSLSDDPSFSFSLANTGDYSFTLWFKVEGTIETTSLLNFNSGETEVTLSGLDQKVKWSRSDASMDLGLSISANVWIQAGGFYKSDGVYFFANANEVSLSSVASTTGLDLAICDSMAISTSRLRLHLLSVWNTKQPTSRLKSTSGNRVI